MPPFLGQGMCSGIRDAANLSWKLDLVMRDEASEELLDSYQVERSPHVKALIETSVEAGKIVCVTDPESARQRDAALRGLTGDALPPPPTLHGGVEYLKPDGTPGDHAGELSKQGCIKRQGRDGLLGDLVHAGWVVLSSRRLDPTILPERLRDLPVRLLQVTPAPTDSETTATDLDGVYEAWFAELRCRYVVIRPDLYVYGATDDPRELAWMLEGLEQQLFGRRSSTLSTTASR